MQSDAFRVLAGFGIPMGEIEELREKVKLKTPRAKL